MTTHDISDAAGSAEVYGFVGFVSSAVALVLYLIWAFVPDEVLEQHGITYYPTKHWAVAIPAWFLVAVVSIVCAYEGLNMMCVKPLTDIRTVRDGSSKAPASVGLSSAVCNAAVSMPPLCHVPLEDVSRVLYGGGGGPSLEHSAGAGAPGPRLRAHAGWPVRG